MKAEDVRDNWNVVVNWDDAEVIKVKKKYAVILATRYF